MTEGGFWPTNGGNELKGTPKIKVVGVGGGGSNAVSRMFTTPIPGVEYIVSNTDSQALQRNQAPMRVQLGEQ